MSDPVETSLQFEHAEGEVAAAVCQACQQEIAGFYFTIGDKILCERCKTDVELRLGQRGGFLGVLRAIGWASLAGAVGAAVWWGVRTYMHLEIGLIAIGIGHFVGKGVRRGSGGVGGRGYQVLALALTYFWIAANYAPDVVKGLFEAASSDGSTSVDAPKVPSIPEPPAGTPNEAGGSDPSPTAAPAAAASDEGGIHPLLAIPAFVAVVMGIAMAAPFLEGFENIIGLLIIAFGLFEAWRLNQGLDLSTSGPFAVKRAAASVPPPPPIG